MHNNWTEYEGNTCISIIYNTFEDNYCVGYSRHGFYITDEDYKDRTMIELEELYMGD